MHFIVILLLKNRTLHHLNLGCGWFGISESQRVTAHPDVILQDEGTLRGGGDLPCRQAAAHER